MLDKLNSVLLADNVCEEFYKAYKTDNFKNWLLETLPEVEKCRKLKQDNPWHIYNCLDHILHSVENINRLSKDLEKEDRRLLSYTMFLHDIGKPECHIRRYSQMYNRYIDSFFDHNKAGVNIANRVLGDLGFGEVQKEQIKALIDDHDMFMFLTLEDDGNKYHKVLDESVIDQEISKLNRVGNGNTLMQYLIWVGVSDNLAQNPKLTGDSLQLISVMDSMLNERLATM